MIDEQSNQIIVGAKYVQFCFRLCMLKVYLPLLLGVVAKFGFYY